MSEHRLESRVRRSIVLGTVFPCMDTAPPRDAELERAFLQLAYAVSRLSHDGSPARGYLGVVQQDVHAAAQRLLWRYQARDVHIVFQGLLISDMSRLTEAAEAATRAGDESLLKSVAREIALDTLRREIVSLEPNVVERPGDPMPFGVAWDFCGTVSASEPSPPSDDAGEPQPT